MIHIRSLYGKSSFVIHRETISRKCQLRSCNYLEEYRSFGNYLLAQYRNNELTQRLNGRICVMTGNICV